MAKMSMINREIKRQKLVKQFTGKILELKKIVKNPKSMEVILPTYIR